jgi:hypothetical protein
LLAYSLTLCATIASAQAVDDQSRSAARKLGYSGVEAYQAGDYKTAQQKLEKAYRVVRVPSVGLWSARALVQLGQWVEASERYQELARLSATETGDPAVQKKALAEAANELKALLPRIPTITVQVEGAEAAAVRVTVDGKAIVPELVGEPLPVNPGKHQVAAARGAEHVELELSVAEAEQKPALLRFGSAGDSAASAPPVAPPGSAPSPDTDSAPSSKLGTQRTLAIVAGGVGLAGVVLGTIFGLKSKSLHDDAEGSCDGSVCSDPSGVTAGNDAYSAGTISTVGMVVGALGIGGGVALWLTAPKTSQTASARLELNASGLKLRGSF